MLGPVSRPCDRQPPMIERRRGRRSTGVWSGRVDPARAGLGSSVWLAERGGRLDDAAFWTGRRPAARRRWRSHRRRARRTIAAVGGGPLGL